MLRSSPPRGRGGFTRRRDVSGRCRAADCDDIPSVARPATQITSSVSSLRFAPLPRPRGQVTGHVQRYQHGPGRICRTATADGRSVVSGQPATAQTARGLGTSSGSPVTARGFGHLESGHSKTFVLSTEPAGNVSHDSSRGRATRNGRALSILALGRLKGATFLRGSVEDQRTRAGLNPTL